MGLGWIVNQQCRRWTTSRVSGATFLCCMCFILFTPTIPRSPKHHKFVDMRNLLGCFIHVLMILGSPGVPNTMNVMTNFPFLVVGILGLVLTLEGGVFNISSQGEVWTWALFYAGIAGVAFGSAYYHLKPDDYRVLWDTLPMMVAFSSLFSILVVERFGQRIGLCCLFALIVAAVLCVVYERIYNDIRFCVIFQLTLPLAIPVIALMYRSKYTHSRYWFMSTGIYLLAKFEGVTDKKLYYVNNYIISGHSMEHLCLALIPVSLSVMLIYRELKFQR
ncbi:hypothetical protein V8G54_007023 [Vigna mungo]|uniref:Ceramidase n=1 Tax=Vigna mungo TaxID=3915 RepID=A0AAQ3P2N8_VIGMU